MPRIRKPIDGSAPIKSTKSDIVWNIAVYIRLSREDGNEESESVINQKKILSEYLESYFEDSFTITD
jgi:hypothetical protein